MTDTAPLTGIKVVDMTEALAGPYCAMLLGDLGADVIKVERARDGDQARGWGPPFLETESAYFLAINRNKRSIELDVKDPADLRVLHTLVGRADVFLTNNPRIESLARSSLDPDTLRSRHPRLVYAAISGYGHTGPKANRGGYDIIAQGEAGLMALTGPVEGGPSRFPSPGRYLGRHLCVHRRARGAVCARQPHRRDRRRAGPRHRARRRAARWLAKHRRDVIRNA